MMTFETRYEIKHIVIAGVGGTGSALARLVARILYDMAQRNLHLPGMILVDPDTVDASNIGRQSGFAPTDVGEYKAELLARRFNAALGLDIAWDAAPFNPELHAPSYGVLLVGCVDNHVARQSLAAAAQNTLWLDGGNNAQSGQVICGTHSDPTPLQYDLKHRKNPITSLPNVALVCPELLEPEALPAHVADASCADMVQAGTQHLLINDMIATVMANYIYRLLWRQPLTSFMTYVSLEAVRPIPITRENLLPFAA